MAHKPCKSRLRGELGIGRTCNMRSARGAIVDVFGSLMISVGRDLCRPALRGNETRGGNGAPFVTDHKEWHEGGGGEQFFDDHCS